MLITHQDDNVNKHNILHIWIRNLASKYQFINDLHLNVTYFHSAGP